jgi:hypothetical protein
MGETEYQKFIKPEGKTMGITFLQPELHERLFNKILSGNRGGKSGSWSPKKSEILALAYKNSGGRYTD